MNWDHPLSRVSTQQRLWFWFWFWFCVTVSVNCCSQADQQEWREITFLIPQVTKSSLSSAPICNRLRIRTESDETAGVYSSRTSGSGSLDLKKHILQLIIYLMNFIRWTERLNVSHMMDQDLHVSWVCFCTSTDTFKWTCSQVVASSGWSEAAKEEVRWTAGWLACTEQEAARWRWTNQSVSWSSVIDLLCS